MAIRCIKYKIRFNGKSYYPGEIIKDMPKIEEKRLIEEGYAEKLDVIVVDSQDSGNTDGVHNTEGQEENEGEDLDNTPDTEEDLEPTEEELAEGGPETGYPEEVVQKTQSSGKRK